MLQVQLALHPAEILVILGIRACVTTLDYIHAQIIEYLGDRQLVFNRERYSLLLGAIPQRRVVQLNRPSRGAWYPLTINLVVFSD